LKSAESIYPQINNDIQIYRKIEKLLTYSSNTGRKEEGRWEGKEGWKKEIKGRRNERRKE